MVKFSHLIAAMKKPYARKRLNYSQRLRFISRNCKTQNGKLFDAIFEEVRHLNSLVYKMYKMAFNLWMIKSHFVE